MEILMADNENNAADTAVSIDEIYTLICNATLQTDGVLDMASGISDAISDALTNILSRENKYRGVKIGRTDDGYEIDILVIIRYGERIPDIAWNIQRNVYKALTDELNIEINDVNIHVQGVETLDKGDDGPQTEET